jgi:hypothetical protein
MLLARCISLTPVPRSITIFSLMSIDWMHFLAQSPSPISFVKVIAWQIAWLNKECGDQVNLLPDFDSTINIVALLICLLLLCCWVYFCSVFVEECLAMSSFGWIFSGFLCFYLS